MGVLRYRLCNVLTECGSGPLSTVYDPGFGCKWTHCFLFLHSWWCGIHQSLKEDKLKQMFKESNGGPGHLSTLLTHFEGAWGRALWAYGLSVFFWSSLSQEKNRYMYAQALAWISVICQFVYSVDIIHFLCQLRWTDKISDSISPMASNHF